MVSNGYCIDSDVLIWQLRNVKRRETITAYLTTLAEKGPLSCSVLSVAEVTQGMKQGEELKTERLLQVLDAHPVDRNIAERAGAIVRELRTQGKTLGLADALIAATCLVHGLKLVTLNTRDFAQIEALEILTAP